MNLFADTIEKPLSELPEFAQHHHGPYFVSYEVFAIKVSIENGEIKYSTKGKENAFKSFWSEHRSFGNLFLDEVKSFCSQDEFFSALKESIDYYFLVPLRKTNRVMLSSAEESSFKPVVFLSGVCVNTADGSKAYLMTKDIQPLYPGPWNFLPQIEPHEYNPASYPCSVGVSYLNLEAKCPQSKEEQGLRLVRFISKIYLDYKALRNNVADIYVRYGELWKEHSPDIEYFKEHYQEYIDAFDRSVQEIFDTYQKRYITTKEFATVSPLRHAVLKKIREIHLRRKWDTISKNNVYNIVFKNFSSKLYKL